MLKYFPLKISAYDSFCLNESSVLFFSAQVLSFAYQLWNFGSFSRSYTPFALIIFSVSMMPALISSPMRIAYLGEVSSRTSTRIATMRVGIASWMIRYSLQSPESKESNTNTPIVIAQSSPMTKGMPSSESRILLYLRGVTSIIITYVRVPSYAKVNPTINLHRQKNQSDWENVDVIDAANTKNIILLTT